jgi:hypothetical protein
LIRLRRTPRKLLFAASVLALTTGCEDVSVTVVEVASIAVSPGQLDLLLGETVQVSATPRSAGGDPLPGRSIAWESEDASVAGVSTSGVVTAHGVGQTRILASSRGIVGAATVVVQARPTLSLDVQELRFDGVAGEDRAHLAEIAVENAGSGELEDLQVSVTWEQGAPTGWIQADLDDPATPTTVRVVASSANLTAGTYEASLRIEAPAADNSPFLVPVEFEVAPDSPLIGLSPSIVAFAWAEGEPEPSEQVVVVLNAGGGELTGLTVAVEYPSGQVGGWLSAHLQGTIAPTALRLAVSPGSLGPGTHDGFARVDSPVAVNGPQRVRVRLTVGASEPRIALDPGEVAFIVTEGADSPLPGEIQVVNEGSGTLGELSATVSFPPEGPDGWLQAALDGSTAPTLLNLSLDPSGLAPGSHTALVEVTSPDASNSPQAATVTLEVLPRASPAHSELRVDRDTVPADGVSTALVEVLLRDERGDPMPFGGDDVELESSTGALGPVTDRGDGTYHATFTAPTTAGVADVTGIVNGEPVPDTARIELVLPAEISAALSSVVADPAEVTADGTSASVVTVSLRDPEGSAILEQRAVTLSLEGVGSLSSATPDFDGDSGTYTAELTSTSTGTATVTAVADGVTLEDRPSVDFVPGPPSPDASSAEVPDGTVGVQTIISITVRDAHGNPLGGQASALSVSVTGANSATPSVAPRGGGNYRASYVPTSAGTDQVVITLSGAPISGSPYESSVTAGEDDDGR